MVGLARWMRQGERVEESIQWMRRGVERGLRDDLMFRTLWDIALLEKKQGRDDAALAAFTELATSANPFRVAALEELAKHYEHRERNYAMAMEMTLDALKLEESEELRKRRERLERRLATRRAPRLL
jgi:hypothetical protein